MVRKPKVLVAMSGGVDSSVAAALLLREGYDVVGCFMRLGSPGETLDTLIEDAELERREGSDHNSSCDPLSRKRLRIGHQGCCSINDAADARLVASRLGIPFYVVNFKKDFGRIIDYFVAEYNAGRTPNPCVRCNDWLKFGRLHDYAKQIDAQCVASGHYARIDRSSRPAHGNEPASTPRLLRGIDHGKDQSYVLFGAPRERLSEMLLPIGEYRKTVVRQLARQFELPVFDKPDSQEICFVPDNDYAGLVARRTPDQIKSGTILDRAGRAIGEHRGHQHFTIGQRKGVGVALGRPVYVVDKSAATNTIVIGDKEELLRARCFAHESNWLVDAPDCSGAPPHACGTGASSWLSCAAKIRYNAQPVPARVRTIGPEDQRSIEVEFEQPQMAVAPGQAVVCYGGADGNTLLCGGWITGAQ